MHDKAWYSIPKIFPHWPGTMVTHRNQLSNTSLVVLKPSVKW